jgi:uncharacterized spore protein YtfJ
MPVREFVESLAERLGASADVKKVYGEAVTAGDKTIIPVAKIAYGFGGGSGGGKQAGDEGGGGGGLHAAPAGVIEISPAGTRFIPTDVLRPLAAATLAGLAAGFLIGRFRR